MSTYKMMLVLLISIVFLTLPTTTQGQELSQTNKMYVTIYAHQYINHPDAELVLRGILNVESSNGQFKIGKLDPSFGIGQMKVGTARGIAKKYHIQLPQRDDELIRRLLLDDKLAIQLSAAYLGYLWKMFNNLDLTVIAYNRGEGWVIDKLRRGESIHVEYLNKVTHAINHEFNIKYERR